MNDIGDMLERVGKLFDVNVKLQGCREQGCPPDTIKALEAEGDRVVARIDVLPWS